jgi:uncharacterized protein (DUF2344 family)
VCGSGETLTVVKNTETFPLIAPQEAPPRVPPGKKADQDVIRVLFLFEKKGKAVFLSHLNLVNVFQMAFRRAKIEVAFSAGFNPAPLLDFASPLPLGVAGENEAATIDLAPGMAAPPAFDSAAFVKNLNAALPQDIAVRDAMRVTIAAGVKKYSVAALFWGSVYTLDGGNSGEFTDPFTVPFKEEKAFKARITAERGSLWGLTRVHPLAFNPKTQTTRRDYRDVYRELYL